MKRSDFFKRIIGGAIAVAVVPEVLAAAQTKNLFNVDLINKRIKELRRYPLTYKECYYVKGIEDHYERMQLSEDMGLLINIK